MEQIGRYKIVEEIGQGATSRVYKGFDATLNRFVAVKAIAAEVSGDETLRRRFEREAQSAALLNHPNIVTVYDFGQERDKLFMAMELLEGVDLKQALVESRLRTLEEKLDVLDQICEGLAFAHAHGIVHRDLKPANIHVLPSGQVKIMDFGLARPSGSDMTRTGLVMGTPHYMSPEQVRGEHVDARSDVFSLGCLFYELLAGQKPFDADSLHSVLYKVMQAEPTPLAKAVPGLPLALIQVVEKALARSPADRFQDAAQLREFLGRAREAIARGRGEEPLPGLTGATAPVVPVAAAAARVPAQVRETGGAAPGSASGVPRSGERTSGARSRSVVVHPAPRKSEKLVTGILAVALVALAIGAIWWARRETSFGVEATPAPAAPKLDNLARAVVETQVELARKKLDAGDYEQALRQAQRALNLDPESAEAKAILAQATRTRDQIGQAVADARAGAAPGGDKAKAADAYWQLLQLNPNDPAAAELAPSFDPAFKTQADKARGLMSAARLAAEKAQAARLEGFKDGVALSQEGDANVRAKAYAAAALNFMRARALFEKTLR